MAKDRGWYEKPPPKTSKPVKHLAGKLLKEGNKPERTLAASVERHIEPRKAAEEITEVM